MWERTLISLQHLGIVEALALLLSAAAITISIITWLGNRKTQTQEPSKRSKYDTKRETDYGKGFLLLALSAIVLWVLNIFIVGRIAVSYEQMGQMGDLFGASNSLFGGLALAALVITLWMQRQELQLQREQLARSMFAEAILSYWGVNPGEFRASEGEGPQPYWTGMVKDLKEVDFFVVHVNICNMRPVPIYPQGIHGGNPPRYFSQKLDKSGGPVVIHQGQASTFTIRIPPNCFPLKSFYLRTQDGQEWPLPDDERETANEQVVLFLKEASRLSIAVKR